MYIEADLANRSAECCRTEHKQILPQSRMWADRKTPLQRRLQHAGNLHIRTIVGNNEVDGLVRIFFRDPVLGQRAVIWGP